MRILLLLFIVFSLVQNPSKAFAAEPVNPSCDNLNTSIDGEKVPCVEHWLRAYCISPRVANQIRQGLTSESEVLCYIYEEQDGLKIWVYSTRDKGYSPYCFLQFKDLITSVQEIKSKTEVYSDGSFYLKLRSLQRIKKANSYYSQSFFSSFSPWKNCVL